MPRPSPRVQVILKHGTPAYVRDGKVYEGGIFGGDLDEAVRGNPAAESHAKAYQNQMIGGFVASLAGGVSLGTGLVLTAGNAVRSSADRSSSQDTLAATFILGGLAATIVSAVLFSTAPPHMWDAINVYNDGLPDTTLPPYGPMPLYPPASYGPPPPAPLPPPAQPQAPPPRGP
jgi:hypothetical protein